LRQTVRVNPLEARPPAPSREPHARPACSDDDSGGDMTGRGRVWDGSIDRGSRALHIVRMPRPEIFVISSEVLYFLR
jgi:hypothetical protein